MLLLRRWRYVTARSHADSYVGILTPQYAAIVDADDDRLGLIDGPR